MSRFDRSSLPAASAAVLFLLVVVATPAAASPAPISACPPCAEGFVNAAYQHGFDTEVRYSEATVRVDSNGSAAWTVRVVPTNESTLEALAANDSLAAPSRATVSAPPTAPVSTTNSAPRASSTGRSWSGT